MLEDFYEYTSIEESGSLPNEVIEVLKQATKNPKTPIEMIFAGERMILEQPTDKDWWKTMNKYLLLILCREPKERPNKP